jgi:hypothetical protein
MVSGKPGMIHARNEYGYARDEKTRFRDGRKHVREKTVV